MEKTEIKKEAIESENKSQDNENQEKLNEKEVKSPKHEENHTKECKECKKLREENHKITKEMIRLKDECFNLDDSYKRKVAEFDNYRKRMLKQLEEAGVESAKKIVTQILPILDNFGRALKDSETNKSFDSLLNGLKITNSQINSLLDHLGVKAIDAVDKEFNPNLHEALMMEEREEVEFDKTVVEEFEKGYMIGDSVIRHSKVKVAKKINK
jgi:molecular chaperone GrpE